VSGWRVAGRWLVRTLPPEDRCWGEALLAELDAVPRRRRLLWGLGLLRLSMARMRSARAGACVGGLAGLLVAADLAYFDLGSQISHQVSEPIAPALIAYGLLGGLFLATGFVRRGHEATVAGCARTTAISATAVVAVGSLTTLVIDYVWLETVARQPGKLYGVAHSPLLHTMRAYLFGGDALGLLIVTPLGVTLAAGLGALGALARG
jgi:hypothetical protein